jgi:hypothetical protein
MSEEETRGTARFLRNRTGSVPAARHAFHMLLMMTVKECDGSLSHQIYHGATTALALWEARDIDLESLVRLPGRQASLPIPIWASWPFSSS